MLVELAGDQVAEQTEPGRLGQDLDQRAMSPGEHALRARIKAAFADVAAGGGRSIDALHRSLDADGETATASADDHDTARHWSDYSSDQLEACAAVLPLLSVGDWRFHLPAFLLAALDQLSQPVWETGLPGAVLFNLTYAADDRVWSRKLLDRFQSLDAAQTAAVRAFLEFVADNPNQEPLRGLDADKALRRYWHLQERAQPESPLPSGEAWAKTLVISAQGEPIRPERIGA
ncbi:MAG: hypothetical protein Q8M37_07690 [Nevskia sp.]|nr:hypothetical protein [Nevskia sp.]